MADRVPTPPAVIQEELARLIDSDVLRRAPSHARLLRYLVEKRVAGDEMALRETSIALEVFRRDPSTYDPQTDPIVRVTTGRLRDRLASHYSRFDNAPKVRIVLPKGRYAPEFVAEGSVSMSRPGLAVLATRNHTTDAALDGCCSEFADQLTDRLARAGFPRVIARGSIASAEARSRDMHTLGMRLDVPWLLDSTLSREHRHELRLSVRMVQAGDASVRWVETSVGSAADVYRLLDRMLDIASLRTLETVPAGAALREAAHAHASLPGPQRGALEQARLLLLRRSVSGTDEAMTLADAVVRGHDDCAEAWATLSATQYSRMSFMDRDHGELLASLRATVDRALALEPDQPIALRTKAIIAGKCDYDADAAESLFLRALRSMPHYTSARTNYAEILTLGGRFDEALAQLGLARLHDPLSGSVHLARAICLGYQRRYAEARDAWKLCRAAGEASQWIVTGEAMTELAAGDTVAAKAFLDAGPALDAEQPVLLICHACLYAVLGDEERSQSLERMCVERFPYYSPAHRAILAALRGHRDAAVALLEAAFRTSDMGLLSATMHPAFDRLGEHPALLALRGRCPVWARRDAANRSQDVAS